MTVTWPDRGSWKVAWPPTSSELFLLWWLTGEIGWPGRMRPYDVPYPFREVLCDDGDRHWRVRVPVPETNSWFEVVA